MADLQNSLEEFKATLSDKTEDELVSLEKEIVAEAQEKDKIAAEKTFTLKSPAGEELSEADRATYGNIIAAFLGRVKTNWQSAIMMKYIIEFWRGTETEVKYPVLDTTLRQLGTIEFTGYEDFNKVTLTNEFFEGIRTEFVEFTDSLFEIANRHDAVMKELELRKPVEAKD